MRKYRRSWLWSLDSWAWPIDKRSSFRQQPLLLAIPAATRLIASLGPRRYRGCHAACVPSGTQAAGVAPAAPFPAGKPPPQYHLISSSPLRGSPPTAGTAASLVATSLPRPVTRRAWPEKAGTPGARALHRPRPFRSVTPPASLRGLRQQEPRRRSTKRCAGTRLWERPPETAGSKVRRRTRPDASPGHGRAITARGLPATPDSPTGAGTPARLTPTAAYRPTLIAPMRGHCHDQSGPAASGDGGVPPPASPERSRFPRHVPVRPQATAPDRATATAPTVRPQQRRCRLAPIRARRLTPPGFQSSLHCLGRIPGDAGDCAPLHRLVGSGSATVALPPSLDGKRNRAAQARLRWPYAAYAANVPGAARRRSGRCPRRRLPAATAPAHCQPSAIVALSRTVNAHAARRYALSRENAWATPGISRARASLMRCAKTRLQERSSQAAFRDSTSSIPEPGFATSPSAPCGSTTNCTARRRAEHPAVPCMAPHADRSNG